MDFGSLMAFCFALWKASLPLRKPSHIRTADEKGRQIALPPFRFI
jgi:hypothetical protein